MPKEETFPSPLKYIDVTRATYTNLDVLQDKRIDDYWNVDSNRHLSDSWKGFTKFTLLKRETSKGIGEGLKEDLQEIRKLLNQQTQKMTLKPAMTFGQLKEISFMVITSNLEFSFPYRKKKHSQSTEIHWCDQGQLYKSGRVARLTKLMIIGMWTRFSSRY